MQRNRMQSETRSRQPVLIILALCSIVLTGSDQARAVETGDLEKLRTEALALVNADRRQHGLDTLELAEPLNEAAQSHAEDMLRRDYYAHVSPDGETVQDRFIANGGSRWQLVAENIGRCVGCPSPPTVDRIESLQTGWMDSPGHRENILMEGLDRFGFGIIIGDDQTLYAVQTFAGAGSPRGLTPDEEQVALSPAEQAQHMVRFINKARDRESLAPLEQSDALTEAAAAMLPDESTSSSLLNQSVGLYEAVPGNQGDRWQSLSVVAGGCGGCGTTPTAADVRYFRDQWLDNPQYAETLLDPDTTQLGFVMGATGEGRKVAVAVLGTRR